MSTEVANRHANLSRRLARQANYELERKGDRVQASEKASVAVAHAFKAIAEDRQWRDSSHHLRRTIASLLAAEFAQPDLMALQGYADRLHENWFEDRMHDWELRGYLDRMIPQIESLWELREKGSNPDFVPTPEQQRTIDRLLISEEEAAANPLIDYPPPMPPFEPPEGEPG